MPGDDVYISLSAGHVKRALDVFGVSVQRARRVVIIGAGNIGLYVARALERVGGVRVRLIERDKRQAERAADMLRRTVVLNGDGLDRDVLREADVEDCELALCLTNDDKVNLLSAVMAKREGALRALTLVNDQAFHPVKAALDVDVMIDPRSVVPASIMPPYGFMAERALDMNAAAHLATLRAVGVPYTDEQIDMAQADLWAQADPDGDHGALLERYPNAETGNLDGDPDRLTEMDALVAYLQVLGRMVDFSAYETRDLLQ